MSHATAMSARWWAKFEREPLTGCLRWTGTVDRAGYGRSKGNGPAKGEVYVHRIVYAVLVEPLPPRSEAELDHDCHNRDEACRGKGTACLHRRCGDLEHLVLKTHADNKQGALKAYCKRGHPKRPNRSGRLVCPTCAANGQRRFRERIANGEIPLPDYLVYKPTGRPLGRPKRST